jgi:Tfp pilus assembly protein PilO
MSFQQFDLSKLAPASRRTIAITLGALLLCVAAVACALRIQRPALRKSAQDVDFMEQTLRVTSANISQIATIRSRVTATNSTLETICSSGILEPLLGSYATRAKSLLDSVAFQTGFRIENVRELQPIPLRLPQPPPQQRYVRQPIEFVGQGSYDQIANFVERAEQAQPLVVLHGLSISGQPQNLLVHKAVITFEWPAKGEVVKETPPTTAKGKAKKAPKAK